MSEEELCERICQLEKELKEEKEKNKRIKDGILYVCRRNGKSHELKMVLEEYISKDKIKEKIKYYYAVDNIVGVRILENLMEENNK